MPRFTDPPYFLLKNFFDGQQVPGAPPVLELDDSGYWWSDTVWQDWDDWKWKDANFWSWVRWVVYTVGGWSDGCSMHGQYPGAGQGHGIVAKGGAGTELWVLTPATGEDQEFKKIKILFSEIDGNFFRFFKNHNVETQTWEAGSSVFFRKNSLFHEWLRGQKDLYKRYVNTERPFMYFGPIFPIGNPTSEGDQYFHIEFWGLKDWTVAALPMLNRTERIRELFNLYFDRLHHEAYQALKEVATLLDPIECDIDYLGLISQLFNVTLVEEIPDELRKRQFVESIINWLKRKGTYTSIFSIFRIMMGNTFNRLNIYERWHRGKNPPGDAIGDPTVTSPVLPYFQDFNYLAYYGMDYTPPVSGSCTNGAGDEYYSSLGVSGYPDTFGTPTTGAPASAAMYLSPHYKVEIDLSCEPLGSDFIIDQFTIESLVDYFELVRPVSRVSHYRYLLSPVTNFDGAWIPLYSAEYSAIMNSIITDPIIGVLPGGAILVQIYNSDEWDFFHGLGTVDVIVQAFDNSYNLIYPEEIVVIDNNNVKIVWDRPVSGQAFAYLKAGTAFHQAASSTIWNVVHNQGQWDVLSQYDHIFTAPDPDERRKMIPISVDLVTDNSLQAQFSEARDGWAITTTADYTHHQIIPATAWQVNHGLHVKGIQIQVVDSSREMIMPSSITILTDTQCLINFESAQTGWVLIKAVGQPLTQTSIIDKIEPGGYIKVGNGTGLETWNPAFNNDLKSPIYTVYWPNWSVTRRTSMFHFNCDFLAPGVETNITEIGIFDRFNKLWFYTRCDPVYKPSDVGITLHYRIRR